MIKTFIKYAGIRAIKTFAQTMLSLITIGQAFIDVNWLNVISISGVSAFLSICTSIITGLPEIDKNGNEIIENDTENAPKID